MGDVLEFNEVVQENRGAHHPGRLKLQEGSIIFKNVKTGRMDTWQGGDITKAAWLTRARGSCLKLTINNGTIHRFDGLKEMEFEKLQKYIKNNYDVMMEKQDMSYRGWNWGTTEFVDNALDFKVNDKLAFEIPLNSVANSTVGKNEVTLEFHNNDDANVNLMELRFHIPPSKKETDETDKENEETDKCEEFCQKVLDKADIIQIQGDAIAIFQEIHCLTPRGRYDVKIYPTFLQLHGKTFDYKIPFNSILRLFLLPHRDQRQMFFIVSMDPPIKQGQTRYPFLIMLFNKEDETTLELSLTDEEITEKYEDKIQKEMSGLEYEVVSRIMKTFVNRKITVPGVFLGKTGTQCVACSYKAATGFLYPLERGFFFAHKPPLHIRFDEVASVNFGRSSGNTRSFDFDIETKNGNVFTFVGIEKDEYGKMYDFVTEKKLRVKNVGSKTGGANYDLDDSDDDGQVDAYMERMKREGKSRAPEGGEDDDESTDESYHLPDGPEDSLEVAEEFDTDYSSSGREDNEDEDYKVGSGEEEDEATKEARREKKEQERSERKEKKLAQREKADKGDKVRRKRKTKKPDDGRPKKPATAYMGWLSSVREKIKEENPGISVTDLVKIAGLKWRELTADDKAPYEEQYQADRVRYLEEFAKWKEEHKDDPVDAESPQSKKSKPTKKTKPKAKSVTESSSGAGAGYKSKEFIESSGSDSESGKKKSKAAKSEKSDKSSGEEAEEESGNESD